jgi:hypothetical protein
MPARYRVLVACEYSGTVRDAFISAGCDAVSCDLLSSERPGPHLQADVLSVLHLGWDLMIAHPPCTFLSNAGAQYWSSRFADQVDAALFFLQLLNASIPRVCVENPRGFMSQIIGQADQELHPYQFGDPFQKRTCLWLRNLPPSICPAAIAPDKGLMHYYPNGRHAPQWFCHFSSYNPEKRRRERSRFFPSVAAEMARQWAFL